jgi:DNA-binding Lrp family transcriptional regulator
MSTISELDRQLLNSLQRDFPLESRPFKQLAEKHGLSEQEIVDRLSELQHQGVIGRFGAVFNHHRAGASTLVALAIPEQFVEQTAQLVNQFEGINHNYLREHEFNMWFVVTGPDREAIDATLNQIEQETSLPMLDLPMEQAYHIDLGFPL